MRSEYGFGSEWWMLNSTFFQFQFNFCTFKIWYDDDTHESQWNVCAILLRLFSLYGAKWKQSLHVYRAETRSSHKAELWLAIQCVNHINICHRLLCIYRWCTVSIVQYTSVPGNAQTNILPVILIERSSKVICSQNISTKYLCFWMLYFYYLNSRYSYT